MDDVVVSRPSVVLVVDDDAAIRTLVRALLERQGIVVDAVGDGASALRLLQSIQYDAIVLDLMLPGTNGFEVVRHLKNVSPEVLDRVIVVTAAADRTLTDFDSAVVRKMLRKPFDIDDLVSEVLACRAVTPPRRALSV